MCALTLKSLTRIVVAICLLLVFDRSEAIFAQPPAYTATYLGSLGGTIPSEAFGINNLGQVVGRSFTTGNAAVRAVLYSGTGTDNLDLGDLGANSSIAYGINDFGQIVGAANPPGNNAHATLFSGTGTGNLDLGSIAGNGSGAAIAINNLGQIVGFSTDAGNSSRATLFSSMGNVNLGTVSASANAINDAGQIVGEAAFPINFQRPTLFSGSGTDNFDLGTLAPMNVGRGMAFGINNLGQIVGRSDTNTVGSDLRATLFSGTGSGNVNLGTLGGTNSVAYSINNSGQIVGQSFVTDNLGTAGFVYTAGTMYNLNSVTSNATNIRFESNTQETGKRINDWGQIAAIGVVGSNNGAIRLNPVDPLTSTSQGGSIINTKFVGGMNFNLFPTSTDPGNLGTTVSLLGGIAGNGGLGQFGLNRDFNVVFLPPNPILPLSSVVDFTGTEVDTFVLQLSYDESLVTSLLGDQANARLGWLNNGIWGLAVDGNIGGTPLFVMGAWDPSYGLGTYGVDTAANTVWGVINHNSNFGVWGESTGDVPDTEGTIDIAGFDFFGFETVNPGPNQVSFLEITYDGVSPIIINTFFNDANGFDTEIGLYDSSGLLIESNDNANSTLQSHLVLKDLPAGTYYLAAGLFNTTFGATDFQATSNSGVVGIFRVDALTFPENVVAGDVNGDGLVNLLDIAPFINALVTNGYSPEADVNCDGAVNLLDVSPFVELLSGN